MADQMEEAVGGHRGPHPCMVLEHPKCGRTWMGLLLTSLGLRAPSKSHGWMVHAHPYSLSAAELSDEFSRSSWRYEAYLRRTNLTRTLLLVRDPMDVLVSSYFERKYRAAGMANGRRPGWAQGRQGRDYSIPRSMSIEAYAAQPIGSIQTCAPARGTARRAPRAPRATSTPALAARPLHFEPWRAVGAGTSHSSTHGSRTRSAGRRRC